MSLRQSPAFFPILTNIDTDFEEDKKRQIEFAAIIPNVPEMAEKQAFRRVSICEGDENEQEKGAKCPSAMSHFCQFRQ